MSITTTLIDVPRLVARLYIGPEASADDLDKWIEECHCGFFENEEAYASKYAKDIAGEDIVGRWSDGPLSLKRLAKSLFADSVMAFRGKDGIHVFLRPEVFETYA